jgi:hypothetical protein
MRRAVAAERASGTPVVPAEPITRGGGAVVPSSAPLALRARARAMSGGAAFPIRLHFEPRVPMKRKVSRNDWILAPSRMDNARSCVGWRRQPAVTSSDRVVSVQAGRAGSSRPMRLVPSVLRIRRNLSGSRCGGMSLRLPPAGTRRTSRSVSSVSRPVVWSSSTVAPSRRCSAKLPARGARKHRPDSFSLPNTPTGRSCGASSTVKRGARPAVRRFASHCGGVSRRQPPGRAGRGNANVLSPLIPATNSRRRSRGTL